MEEPMDESPKASSAVPKEKTSKDPKSKPSKKEKKTEKVPKVKKTHGKKTHQMSPTCACNGQNKIAFKLVCLGFG